MLRIMVTGKPSGWTNVKPVEGSKVTARFTLTEQRWIGGQFVDFKWTCCVPAHKETWAKARTEKGYTVAVEARDVYYFVHTETTPHSVEPMLMIEDVSSV